MRNIGWVVIILLRHRVIVMGVVDENPIAFQMEPDDEARRLVIESQM